MIENEEISFNDFKQLDEGMQNKELYAYYGRIMFAYQCLEHAIVNILVLANTDLTQEYAESFYLKMESEFKKTFGKLINSFKKIATLDATIINKLEYILKKRNFLAHAFFKESIYEQVTPEGKYRLINKLIDIEKDVKSIDELLSPIYKLLLNEFVDGNNLFEQHLKTIENGDVDLITKIKMKDFYS